MTQQEHLTTEQLSAFLDKQLTPREQAFFDAHLSSCQRCQHVLAELRRTVALLSAMPQPQLPRSFTLPAGIAQEPRQLPRPVEQRRVLRYTLQRSVRAVSTLAAAIAVIFILSGLLSGMAFHGGGASSTSGSVPVASSNGNSNGATHNAAGARGTLGPQSTSATPGVAASPELKGHQTRTPRPSPAATPVPTASATSTNDNTGNSSLTNTPPTLPPYLDISQPEGRLSLGALLLLLGIAGIIATRRRRDTVR